MGSRPAWVAAAVGALLLVQGAASAGWSDGAAASGSISSATLAAPTSPATAAGQCVPLSADRIVVSWSASSSAWATGYEIARSATSGGPFSAVGTVNAPAVSYSDGPLAFSTTYYYVVRATKDSWRSADTVEVTKATRTPLCV